MLCGFTCLILNCVLHLKIDLFRTGVFVKIEEPTVLVMNMFSEPSLTLKPIMSTLLYWAMIQTVGFILFQVKVFWFGWRSIDVRPIDFAIPSHFASLEQLAHIYWWQIKELHICLDFSKLCRLWGKTFSPTCRRKAEGLPSRRVGAESPGAWLPAATIGSPRHYPLGVGRVTESGLLLSESAYFLCRSALARHALQA